jgi:hypothetical protein
MHTSANKGTPVVCIFKDGSQLRGKFVERRSRYILVNDGRFTVKIQKSELRAMTIERQPDNGRD